VELRSHEVVRHLNRDMSYAPCGSLAALTQSLHFPLQNDATISKLVDFVETDHGRSVLWSMHDTNRHQYPHLIEEVCVRAYPSRIVFSKACMLYGNNMTSRDGQTDKQYRSGEGRIVFRK
jgi:hypothetical protein